MVNIISKLKLAVEKPNYILMSLQKVQEDELHIASQNLVNAQNAGYKSFLLSSEESQYKTKDNKSISYVSVTGHSRDLTDGSLNTTRNPLDFGLSGSGYFMVQTPKGIQYTRNGRFSVDTEGRLTTNFGHFVLEQNGDIITIPKNAESFVVSRSGLMSVNGQSIGQIGVMNFDNEQDMQMEGQGLLSTQQQGTLNTNATVTQGAYEESNVSPINISIQLINIMHHFEEAQKLIDSYEQLQRETMNAKAAL